MAENISLARPYAKAVFQTALESKSFKQWSEQLALVATAVGNVELQKTLIHPGLTASQKAQLLVTICDGLADDVKNLISVLADNNRLTLIPDVAAMYEQLRSEQEATVDVHVVSAVRLNAEQKKQLVQSLNNKLERTVNLQSAVNKKLIGGVVIRAGDLVIDASIRGRLAKLAEMVELK